jgi:hypothetical protein
MWTYLNVSYIKFVITDYVSNANAAVARLTMWATLIVPLKALAAFCGTPTGGPTCGLSRSSYVSLMKQADNPFYQKIYTENLNLNFSPEF